MSKGLTILANVNTNQRMIVFVNPNNYNIVKIVNEKYGGNWVIVNELCAGDVLQFESGEDYVGFDERHGDNYCNPNLQLKAFAPS
jgi:hypothetical protein